MLGPVNTLHLQFLISIVAGWVNRGQQEIIEYLQEENRVLRQQLGAKRLLFTDVQRRRLAAKAQKIGRKGLFEIGTLVTPDTLLRWYRRLIAKKYDGSQARRAGRPKTAAEIERLILRMARDNPPLGLHPNPRRTPQSRSRDRAQHDQADPPRERVRPRPTAEEGDVMGDLPEGSLESDCGHGLLQRRGAHADGFGAVLRSFRDRPRDS